MGVSDGIAAMKNADRINFYLAGLRQPGDDRDRPPASEDRSATHSAGGKPAAVESQLGRQPLKDAQAKELGAKELRARQAVRSASPGSVGARSVGAGGFAAALRKQLQEGGEGELAATLDQAQLRRLLERLDHRRERFGLPLDLPPETARKRQRQLILGLLLAALIIALQASAVVWLYQRAEQLLGRPLSPALLLTATQADLDVVFRPSASAGDIAVLLRELQLHVVDGPASSGRYVLRPEAGIEPRRALNALRDRRDLVYSAEAAY